jgi:sugar phosphate isomerase/epimerase
MQLGVFARTFYRNSLEANLDAVRSFGFTCTQYNLSCAGRPTLPEASEPALWDRIHDAHHARGLTMAAISGTFNIIDHDSRRLADNFRRLRVLAEAAPMLGTKVITLCTGTCDHDNMWRHHPDNDTPESWRAMLASIERIIAIAEDTGVVMAVEPEVNNVVDCALKARRLLDDHEAAGTGVLDYDYYLSRLCRSGFDGPLILHSLSEEQVPTSIRFLEGKLARIEVLAMSTADAHGDAPDAVL